MVISGGNVDGRRGKRDCPCGKRTSCPDKNPSSFIRSEALGIDQFVPQSFKVCIIQGKFKLEGSIGYASLALE
jgi:hypothetical protein